MPPKQNAFRNPQHILRPYVSSVHHPKKSFVHFKTTRYRQALSLNTSFIGAWHYLRFHILDWQRRNWPKPGKYANSFFQLSLGYLFSSLITTHSTLPLLNPVSFPLHVYNSDPQFIDIQMTLMFPPPTQMQHQQLNPRRWNPPTISTS